MTREITRKKLICAQKIFAKVGFLFASGASKCKPFAVDEVSVFSERALPPASVYYTEFIVQRSINYGSCGI